MSDHGEAARPEARILRRSGNVVAELGREFARDGRDVDPDFFENMAAHDRNRPTTATRALPLAALEPARRAELGVLAGEFVFDRLKCRAQTVAQLGIPELRPAAPVGISWKNR